MRKSKERSYGSPRFQLQPRSPASHRKLRLPGTASSPRAVQPPKTTAWVPTPQLFAYLAPLSPLSLPYTFTPQLPPHHSDVPIDIISSIDSFIDTYMQVSQSLKIQPRNWYIVCKAVNIQQMQAEFNQMYTPIRFIFMNGISDLMNLVLGHGQEWTEAKLGAVYGAASVLEKHACVREMQQGGPLTRGCLYVVEGEKQWAKLAGDSSAGLPYFITGREQILGDSIRIRSAIAATSSVHYIMLACERDLAQVKGFPSYQQLFNQGILTNPSTLPTLPLPHLLTLLTQTLLPNLKPCLFYPASLPSPTLSALSRHYHLFPQHMYQPQWCCYRLHCDRPSTEGDAVSVSMGVELGVQVERIGWYLEQRTRLAEEFVARGEKLRKMQVYGYGNSKRHCIGDCLAYAGIKHSELDSLQNLYETHKITLIYGTFTLADMKSMSRFYNVFIVPLSRQPESPVCSQQISEAQQFLSIADNAYNNLYGENNTNANEAYVHVLYEKQQELTELLAPLRANEQILKTHFIGNLQSALSDFRQSSRHIMVAPMGIFSQDLEQLVRQVEWRSNTIAIEIYLVYGQEYILRNKQGTYKFIKLPELQAKIDQIEEQYRKYQENRVKTKAAEPILYVLPQIEAQEAQDDDLNDLMVEESVVQPYEECKPFCSHETMQRLDPAMEQFGQQSQISIIYGLSQKKLKEEEQLYKTKLSERSEKTGSKSRLCLMADQTLQLIDEAYRQNSNQNTKMVASLSNKRLSAASDNPRNPRRAQQPSEQSRNRITSRQKATYLSRNNPQPSPQQPSTSQCDQLYILIHRSVPHHCLTHRLNKNYHILVYTKLEQILLFTRYLKPQEKLILLAHEHSQQVYSQLLRKAAVHEGRLQVRYVRDMGENTIKREIDGIVSGYQLKERVGVDPDGKFRALVVYASTERVGRAIRIVRKVFGGWGKLMFMREKEYEEMAESPHGLAVGEGVRVYKVGLRCGQGEVLISSIRGLFVLAMNPDLRSIDFGVRGLLFSNLCYIGRLVYGQTEKNYVTIGSSKDTSHTIRQRIQSKKSESNLFSPVQSGMSRMKTDYSQRRRSQSIRKSSISRPSSSRLKVSTRAQVLLSNSLRESYRARNIFASEQAMYIEIMKAHSLSKLVIAVITEKQYDTFDVFQSKNFESMSQQVIWIVETKTASKKAFVGHKILFTTVEEIAGAVDAVVEQYESKVCYDSLEFVSKADQIKGFACTTNSNKNKKILKVLLDIQNQAGTQTNNFDVRIIINRDKVHKEALQPNLIILPDLESAARLLQCLRNAFEGRPHPEPYQSLGSLVLAPKQHLPKVVKAYEAASKTNTLFQPYQQQQPSALVQYSLLRCLVLVEKQSNGAMLAQSPYALQLEKNYDKLGRLLTATLL